MDKEYLDKLYDKITHVPYGIQKAADVAGCSRGKIYGILKGRTKYAAQDVIDAVIKVCEAHKEETDKRKEKIDELYGEANKAGN